MSMSNLRELFVHEIRDIYDAERRLVEALPRMAKKASADDLTVAFEEHAIVTEKQIERLERVFELLELKPRGKKCQAMEGLLKEGSELLKEEERGVVLDAALIGAAQKVEHYEIASYGTLATHAKVLGMDEAAELLEETLAEEKETDEKLSDLASSINLEAKIEAEQ